MFSSLRNNPRTFATVFEGDKNSEALAQAHALLAAVRKEPADLATLARLCGLLEQGGVDIADHLESESIIPPQPPRLPLFFLHTMRTAGGSLRDTFANQFHLWETLPAWNRWDLLPLFQNGSAQKASLAQGHFLYPQRRLFPQPFVEFTVLRHPIEKQFSIYSFLRTLSPDYPDEAYRNTPLSHEITRWHSVPGIKATLDSMSTCIALAHEHEFAAFYDIAVNAFPHIFKNPSTAQLADCFSAVADQSPNEAHFQEATRNLHSMDIVGTYEQLEILLQLLAHRLCWPALKGLPQKHLSNSQERFQHEVSPSLKKKIADDNAYDVFLYNQAEELCCRALQKTFPTAPDAKSRDRVIDANFRSWCWEAHSPTFVYDLWAEKAWPGTGWSQRQGNLHGQFWRSLHESADLFLNLKMGQDYWISGFVYSADSNESMKTITANVGKYSLPLIGGGMWNEYPWFVWRLPLALVAALEGRVRIDFRLAARKPHALVSFRRLVIRPSEF